MRMDTYSRIFHYIFSSFQISKVFGFGIYGVFVPWAEASYSIRIRKVNKKYYILPTIDEPHRQTRIRNADDYPLSHPQESSAFIIRNTDECPDRHPPQQGNPRCYI